MPSSKKWLLAAPVDIPRRDHYLVTELVKWLGAGGYAARTMRAERDGRTASDTALRAAIAFLETLYPVRFSYELDAPQTFGLDALASMVEDPTITAIHISNAAQFGLRLPFTAGFVTGYFEPLAFDRITRLTNAVTVLFDMHLSDWGVLGPQERLESAFARVRMVEPAAPLPIPAVGPATYVGPDLVYGIEAAAINAHPGIRPTRTPAGGVLFLADQSEDALTMLRAILLPLLCPVARAPISEVRGLTPKPFLLRDASPSLAAYQLDVTGAAIERAAQRGVTGLNFSIESLRRLDTCLGSIVDALPPYVLKGWSAFAGEVAVAQGARWRRILAPYTPFPSSLVVAMPSGGMAQPHAQLMLQFESRRVTGLAPLIAQLLGTGIHSSSTIGRACHEEHSAATGHGSRSPDP